MRKAATLMTAAALLGGLGVAGCHPRQKATVSADPVAVGAAPASLEESKPPSGCSKKVREPDQVTTSQERVLVTPAGSIDRVIPAVVRSVETTVVVTPAWSQTLTRPAVFKTVWRTETTPGRAYAVSTPARWRTVSERVLVAPERTVWKSASGRPAAGSPMPGQAAYAPTGEVMCAVLVPARYALRTRRELVSSGERRTVQGPPSVRRIAERVQISPATSQVIAHPAVTKLVHSTEVVTPEHVISLRTPPVFKLVQRTVRTPRYGWRPIPCGRPKPAPHHAAPHHRPRLVERPYVLPAVHGTPYGERG